MSSNLIHDSIQRRPALANRASFKLVLLSALYAAQGLPYGFFTLALPVVLREAGLSLTAISALSLLYLPWSLKFLWAPYLDELRNRRAWLLALQTSGVIGALVLSQLNVDASYVPIIIGAFAFNLIAASQDVLTDGLAVRVLDARERGLGNGIQVGAYRLGMILGGGLLLWIFARTDWSTMFVCMAVLLSITIVPVFAYREPAHEERAARTPARELPFQWLQRLLVPGMLGFAGLIFCFRFGDAMVSTLLGPFMKDQQVSTETIALMKGTVGSATSLIGALLGGIFTFKVGRRAALLTTGLGQALSFVPYLISALGIGGVGLLWFATIVEGIVGTMATVALFTLMMDASDPEHAGTDYTVLASVYVLVGAAGQFAAGLIADATGFATMFAIGIVLAVAGILVLVFTLDRRPMPARVAEVWKTPTRAL
ncbi:MAG TPA: MFS transporter [Steroidobacteraceae bacterium]